jgi:hypothetical protein
VLIRKLNDSLYEDVLPFVIKDVSKFTPQEVLAVLLAANSVGIKKNQVKRLLQDFSLQKVEAMLGDESCRADPQQQATLFALLKALRPLIWKEEQTA